MTAVIGAVLLAPALLCGAALIGDDDRPDSGAVSVSVHISPRPGPVPLPQDDCIPLCGVGVLPQTGGGEASLLLLAGGVALLAGGVVVGRHVRSRRNRPGV